MDIKVLKTTEYGKGQTDVELDLGGKTMTVRVNRLGKEAEAAAIASITEADMAPMQEVNKPTPRREKA